MPLQKLGVGEYRDDVYRPIGDWMLMPGSRVAEERIQKLNSLEFMGLSELTVDDMWAVNSRNSQIIFWSLGQTVSRLSSPDVAAEVYYQLVNSLAAGGWRNALRHFGTDRLSAAQLAWYQDASHIFYGPHTQAYVEYDERVVTVTRNGCQISYHHPRSQLTVC